MFEPTACDAAFLPAGAGLPLDDQGRIDSDIHCVACEYNLRGLLPDGRCPECGTAVGRSAHGDLLRFSEPNWVESLASGMNWILAGIGVSILVVLAIGVAAGVRPNAVQNVAVLALIGAISGLVSLVGFWKLTTPEPSLIDTGDNIGARELARFGYLASYAVSFGNTFLQNYSKELSLVVGPCATLLSLIGLGALLVYVGRLALRIPDEKLAGSTRIVLWGVLVSMGISLVFGVLTSVYLAMGKPPAGGFLPVWGCTAVIGGLGALVFGIWALVLIFRYRRAFNDAAQQARATWAKPADAESGTAY